MIETSQLQTLIAVAKWGSFSKAAEELHVTQSAISQSVKNLETKLNVRLFHRSGKRVVLTFEGEKLCAMAKKFLLSMEDTIHEIQEDRSGMKGKIRIGTLTGIGKTWLGTRLVDFALDFPDLSINVKLGFPSELVDDFEHFFLDCLIIPEHNLPSIGEKFFLSDEISTLVFPKTFPIDENIDLKTLSSFPIITFEHEDSLFSNWCRKNFGSLPHQFHRRFVINSHGNMLQAVSQGLGIAVIPTHVLRRSYYRDKVSTLGKDFEVSHNRFYFVMHQESSDLVRINKLKERLFEQKDSLTTIQFL